MELFIGTKLVKAKPMKYSEYAALTRRLIDNEKEEEGYLVEDLNSPNNNVVGYSNYISWSPKEVFEESYFSSNNLSFSLALEAMKMGLIVINPYQEKQGLKGIVFGKEETPYELRANGNEYFWLPDLYALRCKEWKIVGMANREN